MNGVDGLGLDPGFALDRLALGLDLFGTQADWIWYMLAFWAVAAMLLLVADTLQQRRRDQAYLSYVAENLPEFCRLARLRAREVNARRRVERF